MLIKLIWDVSIIVKMLKDENNNDVKKFIEHPSLMTT